MDEEIRPLSRKRWNANRALGSMLEVGGHLCVVEMRLMPKPKYRPFDSRRHARLKHSAGCFLCVKMGSDSRWE